MRFERSIGKASVAFKRRGEDTVLQDLFQEGCAKIKMPRPEPGRRTEAVIINTAGGLTGGDVFAVSAKWGPQTTAILTTQAAERYYTSCTGAAKITTRLHIEEAATALWLPQEAIMFDGAIYERATHIDMVAGARLLALEMSVFGRTAMGETVTRGTSSERWQLRLDGRLVFADAFALDGDIHTAMGRPAIANGAHTMATLLYVGPDMAALCDTINQGFLSSAIDGQASQLEAVLVVRMLAQSAQNLRTCVNEVVDLLSRSLHSGNPLTSYVPRLWSF